MSDDSDRLDHCCIFCFSSVTSVTQSLRQQSDTQTVSHTAATAEAACCCGPVAATISREQQSEHEQTESISEFRLAAGRQYQTAARAERCQQAAAAACTP